MSPQFVDFDGDGKKDILVGTYDGSPHIAYGSDQGFRAPLVLQSKSGRRIGLNAYWNHDVKRWQNHAQSNPDGDPAADAHGTSVYAHDWDHDGDLDLLLGDYKGGRLYLRINEGNAHSPAFAEKNVAVTADGRPIQLAGGITTMRIARFNDDDLPDLLIGTMGDVNGDGPGGGIFLFENRGTAAAPSFAEPLILVPVSTKTASEAHRPDTGLYMDLSDLDGDGDQDLVVGGYSHFSPPGRTLSAEEKSEAAALEKSIDANIESYAAINKEIVAAVASLPEAEAAKKLPELRKARQPEFTRLLNERADAQKRLDALIPRAQRIAYVWFYERTMSTKTP